MVAEISVKGVEPRIHVLLSRDGHTGVVIRRGPSKRVCTTQVWYLGGAQGNVVVNAVNLAGANSWRLVSVGDFNEDG